MARGVKPINVDTLIVGGGIVGIGLLRDLALHNQSVLLVDKKDYCSQTSQSSSKMLHGGIRYLESFEFLLIREALAEKNHWCKLTPHLTRELPFHIPIFDMKTSKYPPWMLKIGLFLYDAFSNFNGPGHELLNLSETKKALPNLTQKNLKACGVYYDAIVDDLKLGLECLYDALLEDHAYAENYTALESLTFHQRDKKWIAGLKDQLNGEEWEVKTNNVVFATGPFTDQILPQFFPWKPRLIPSKGIHLWLSKETLPNKVPIVLPSADNRIFFVIPQKDMVLVGTTEEIVTGDFFDITATEKEIDYLLSNMQRYFPETNLKKENILSSFAGIRPLVSEEGKSAHETSRHHKVFMPAKNVFVIIGGKYTTFRSMVQDTARQIVQKRNRGYSSLLTLSPLRQKSTCLPFENEPISFDKVKNILKNECVRTLDDVVKRRIGVAKKNHWKENIDPIPFFEQYIETYGETMVINKEQVSKLKLD